MSAPLRQQIKSMLPAPLWQTASAARYALQRATLWPAATFHPLRRQSVARLQEYRDLHHSKRCFIIGNGPSLKNTDLSKLKGELTFGLNRIYMLFPELGFPSTYLVTVNSLVIEQFAANLLDVPIPKFLSWRSHKWIEAAQTQRGTGAGVDAKNDPIFLHTTYSGPTFAKDAGGRLWEGATVTFVALQLAYYMGFETVILIGVDHNFSTQGKPNTTITSQGDDPNHFNPAYFGKGVRWQLPDLETSERAYALARHTYQQDGRQVLDATLGGKLTIFPKVEYSTLF